MLNAYTLICNLNNVYIICIHYMYVYTSTRKYATQYMLTRDHVITVTVLRPKSLFTRSKAGHRWY